ncbi:hypothetical protein ACHAWT_007918 [Skeletonema menzelii]
MITLRGKLKRSTVSRPNAAAVDARTADSLAITQRQPDDDGSGEVATSATTVASAEQSSKETASNNVETVDVWKWEGVWAFGSLPNNQEEIDKLLNPPSVEVEETHKESKEQFASSSSSSSAPAAAAQTKEETRINKEIATTISSAASSANNTPNQSPNWIQKLSSIITGGDRKSEDQQLQQQQQQLSAGGGTQEEATTPTTTSLFPTIKKRGRGRPPKSSYSPAEAAAMAAKEAARKLAEERERAKPRPFVYTWVEVAEAKEMVVPSSLVVFGVEEDDDDDEEEEEEEDKKEGAVMNEVKGERKVDNDEKKQTALSSADADVEMKDVEELPPKPDNATPPSTTVTDTATSTTTTTTTKKETKKKKQKAKGITYAEPPYTDATTTHPPHTCPNSGKWEGHFENVSLKKGKTPRIKEVFYLFFNGTPAKNAHDAFIDSDLTMKANAMLDNEGSTDVPSSGDDDDDEKKKSDTENDKKHLLKEGCIHVRGHGTNRFGTFEIVGSYDPKTEILQCQRMYVPVTEEKNTGPKKRGRRSRSEAARLLAESADTGDVERGSGRKRKTSWKTRSKDMSSFGDDTTPSDNRKGDIASIVKKRSRLSSDGGGGGVGGGTGSKSTSGGTTPAPQCRGDDGSKLKINMSVLKNPSSLKPSPSPASATTGSGKKSKGKKKASAPFQGAFPGTVVPIAPVPTLPTEGDPFLARWRAAHYLYYQRTEHKPDDDGPTWGASSNPSPGNCVVTVKSVVYEGEMHDGVREGRGLCLYNNNLMYEGGWKRNKEHGKGTLMSPDRSRIIYQGDWEKGRMQGQGTYYYYDALNNSKVSSKYIGEFKENLRHGIGIYTLPDGSIYDGEWRENNPNGWGLFRWPDGSEYQGPWRDGKRNGTNGILLAADGFRYEGAWANNAMEGIGVATYPNGQIYEGKWVGGRREGRGTIRFTNGAVYEGRFKDDYMEGQGTMKMNENVIIANYKVEANDDDTNKEVSEKNDWMIPLQFQSDISHIHQKAGFTQVGL